MCILCLPARPVDHLSKYWLSLPSCSAMMKRKRCVRASFDRRSLVRMSIAANRLIEERLGREFHSAPAWDMMLDLYSRENDEPISITSLCIAANVPMRTAHHVLERMVDQGWMLRTPHSTDRRLIIVSLSKGAIEMLDRCFDDIMELSLINGAEAEICEQREMDHRNKVIETAAGLGHVLSWGSQMPARAPGMSLPGINRARPFSAGRPHRGCPEPARLGGISVRAEHRLVLIGFAAALAWLG